MYRLNAPFTKSRTLRIKVRDLLRTVILKTVKSELTDEYDPNKTGPIRFSTKTMPLTGARYRHQTNGWHVCQDFYRSCCQGAGLKAYPSGTLGNVVQPNTGLAEDDVRRLRAAFNDDSELLFAISTLANTCTSGAIFQGMAGALNGKGSSPVVTFNKKPTVPMMTPDTAIKIKKGKNDRAEIDCIQVWSSSDLFCMCTSGVGGGPKSVKDLGVDNVTYRLHLVLKSSVNSISIDIGPSWARAWFNKNTRSLFSSSASPEDMIEVIDEDFL